MIKKGLFIKFIVMILTAAALVTGVCSGLGIGQLVKYNLYADNINDFLYQHLDNNANQLAKSLAERYAVLTLSNCDDEALIQLGYRKYVEGGLQLSGYNEENYSYTIETKGGDVLESATKELSGETLVFVTRCVGIYPVMVTEEEAVDLLFGKDYLDSYPQEFDFSADPITIREYESQEYVITVTIQQDTALVPSRTSLSMLRTLYELRFVAIFLLALAVILFSAGTVYLCAVAGKVSRNKVSHRGALNYLPLDLYALGGAGLGIWLYSLVSGLIYNWFKHGKDYNAGTLSLVALVFLVIALILLGFVYGIATQLKLQKGYWYRHSALWWLLKKLRALQGLLPLLWQIFLPGLCCLLIAGVCVVVALQGYYLPLILSGVLCLLVMGYCTYAFSFLVHGAKQMAQGDLNAKLNTRYLLGSYKQCADHLNELADVAIVAARKQMQADRMKTELITNVSHDIKTPLTSIINYVDILRYSATEEDRCQYLEVLGRQSQRLKKLIEDLMELSRASTGNMTVHILPLNAEETINQALGEFSDKLEQANLDLMFTPPEKQLTMLADGRMSWRVLSNLLSNAVKYAMPGTRVYLQLQQEDGHVVISLKNISREPLNISAEELTERFVRGDAARRTEGSGLGLNIAKSLMELQNGTLDLQIDGDLFKATLRFPIAEEE